MSIQAQNAQNLYIHAIQDGRVAEAQASSVGIPISNTQQEFRMGKKVSLLSLQIFSSAIQNVKLRLFVPFKMEI